MTSRTLRARLGLAAVAAALAGGFGVAGHADAAPVPEPRDVPTAVAVDDDYWACLALDYVEVGMCLENPLPDLSEYPTVPDIVNGLLSDLPR